MDIILATAVRDSRREGIAVPSSKPTRGFGLLEGFLASKRARIADKLVPPEHRAHRVLDIGCGTHPVFLLKTDFAEKFGLDKVVDESMRGALRDEGITLVNFEIEAGESIPFDGDSFGVVTMLAVVEHIEPERLAKLFAEILRILKPGGFLIVTTPAAWTEAPLRLMARLRLVSSVEIEEHKGSYSPSHIRSILERAGFANSSIQHGYFEMFANMWVLARK